MIEASMYQKENKPIKKKSKKVKNDKLVNMTEDEAMKELEEL